MGNFVLWLALSLAHAGSLAGIDVPDTVDVEGEELVLNGMGLREKFKIDVYVGVLYLPAKTTDPAKAIQTDEAKRLEMHFIYKLVSRDKLVTQYRESMANVPGSEAVSSELETLYGWMEDMRRGDSVVFEYVPGAGTTVWVKGQEKGTIEGAKFMRVLWENYLGENPPSWKLRRGMMGT